MKHQYEIGIIGGGLAGLCASIQLAKKGHSVVLYEKNHYPFHKVCGEYISLESREFLRSLGFDAFEHDLPQIKNFTLSHTNGKVLNLKLPLGAFGVSRHYIDDKLAEIALESGVVLLQGTEVTDVEFFDVNDVFKVSTKTGDLIFKQVLGSYGKRSKLDKKKNRPFIEKIKDPKNNFVGVKYHVKSDIDEDKIELHLFEEGYGGISRVEGDKTCFCYLTTANLLKKSGGDITAMEEKFLRANPHLNDHFNSFEKLWDEPLTISNIEFGPKEQVHNHIIMLGDAAGMITPLTGNGMSMAMHASKLASEEVVKFLAGKATRDQMEANYTKLWQKHFGKRVKRARKYQNMFFKENLVSSVMSAANVVPFVGKLMVKSTHGKSF
ncbi:MAG: NAD(P)/FAD-dependent oxidoreductase [Bacteroidia bacterium]